MRPVLTLLAMTLAAAVAMPAVAADDTALLAELKRLTQRVEALEQQNKEMEKSLTSERISENEPEVITRLKAVEYQTLSIQKQARQIEALEGISVGASLTGVVQKASEGNQGTLANYRGDVAVALPGGEIGNTEGKIFAQLRFGQGDGVALGGLGSRAYTSTPNTTAFQLAGGPADDSTVILAQAWYQLATPLLRDGTKANAREHLHLTFGKIDPFVFFDQNAIADDESVKFINNVFVHNPLLDSGGDIGADTYGFAPGAIAQYVNEREKGSEWGLSLGVFGAGRGADFTGSLSSPLVIAQAETAARLNYLPGNYRTYLWSNGRGAGYDGVERRHSGIGFSADQKVDDALTLFARYGHQIDGKVRFDRALTVAVSWAAAFGDAPPTRWVWLRCAPAPTSAAIRPRSMQTAMARRIRLPGLRLGTAAGALLSLQGQQAIELTPDFQLIRRRLMMAQARPSRSSACAPKSDSRG